MSDIIINPYVFVGGPIGGYDADAEAMFEARAVLGDEPSTPYKLAISNLVTDIKSISGKWDSIIQFFTYAGATTIASAMVPIKGLEPTPVNFLDGDLNIKTGLKGNGSNKYIDTGYTTSSAEGFGQNDIHAFCQVTENPATQLRALFGHAGSAQGATTFIHRLSSTTHSPRARYNSSQSITPPSATALGGYGVNRGGSPDYDALAADISYNLSNVTNTPSSTPRMFIFARSGNTSNTPELFSNSRQLVWALGTNTTLSDYVTPMNDFISALNAI